MPENNTENLRVEVLKTLALSAVLAFGVRTFVAEARYIPSESMLPTLKINDRLLIEKVGYRFKTPERGDIVVFSPTETLKENGYNQAFIKRVIGLPGETITVSGGVVTVDGQPLSENYLADEPDYDFGPVTVPEGHYLVLGDNRNNSYDSHYWGFLPRQNIIGRAAVRFWPLGRMSIIDDTSYPSPPTERLQTP